MLTCPSGVGGAERGVGCSDGDERTCPGGVGGAERGDGGGSCSAITAAGPLLSG